MTAKVFVDTNVLVYAYDRREPDKRERAREVLRHLAYTRVGVISAQVLAEFYVTITRKIVTPLTTLDAERQITNYLQAWTIIDLSGTVVAEAVRGVREYQFSYWDAQIWAAARLNQIPLVLSEDFNVGASIEGVRFANPFSAEFRVAEWI